MKNTNRHGNQTHMAVVVAGLTTIPSRLRQGGLQPVLRSLATQSHALAAIIMTAPLVTMRNTAVPPETAADIRELKTWYGKEGRIHAANGGNRFPRFIVHRPNEDLGPIMKYVGTADVVAGAQESIMPTATAVLIVDDDRIYPADFVASVVAQAAAEPNRNAVLSLQTGLQKLHPKLLSVFGFAGVYMPVPALLAAVAEVRKVVKYAALPAYAARNDDVFMAIMLDRARVPIRATRKDTPRSVPAFGGAASPDALSSNAPVQKTLDIVHCHATYNQQFTTWVIVVGAVLAAAIMACVGIAIWAAVRGKPGKFYRN
jgi:hypothetical protein